MSIGDDVRLIKYIKSDFEKEQDILLENHRIISYKEERWFSMGTLIFWIIVCFPIAFIYLLIKYGDRGSNSKRR